ncbi:MAG: TonB-dependent receptor [Xanthomonadales bacterium]|nr:TonB-dependent receptor [Xanthomonadales bacterium]
MSTALMAQSRVLEEIIVTAQKREQSLQDTAVSITAFSGDAIRQLNLTDSIEVAGQTPNFSVGTPVGAGNNPSIVLRGVGLNDFNDNNESNIAVYVDEIYQSAMAGLTFQMFDMERVEVLRGPQGTLYGRNATGGLVHYVTRQPTSEFDMYGDLTFGRHSQVKFEGAVGGGTETVMARLAVAGNNHDGYVDNRVGEDPNDADNIAVRGKLLFVLSDQWSLLLNGHYSDSDALAAAYQHQGTAGDGFDFFGYKDTDNDVWAGDYDRVGPLKIENSGGFVELNWQGDVLGMKWITGVENVDKFHQEDTDAGNVDFGAGSLVRPTFSAETDQVTSELRFFGSSDKLNWVAGLYYFDNDVDGSGTRLDLSGLFDVDFQVDYQQDTTSYAAFGQVDYRLNDRWELTGGLRYTDEEKDFVYINREVNFDAFVYEFSPATAGDLASQSEEVLSGKVGINFNASDDMMLFGSVSTSFKSGGFNSGFLDPSLDLANLPFDKEDLISYEVGLKSTLAGGRVRFNATAFYYDYKDLQALTFEGVSSFISNASDASITGAEFELIANPTDALELSMGLGLLDAEADGIGLPDGSVLENRNLVLAPDVQFNALGRYTIPFGESALILQLDTHYSDEVFFDIANQDIARQSSYWVWNGSISYRFNEHFDVSVWGKNLFEKEYKVYTFDFSDFFGLNQQMYGPPRWYGVTLRYQY